MERETEPMASSRNRSRAVARLRIVIPLLVVAAGVWAGVVYLRTGRANPAVLTASGTIEASQVSAASKIPGRILRLHAAEGDTVRGGTPLVTMEGRELLAPIDQARGRAVVAATRARLAQAQSARALQQRLLEAQIAQAEAGVDGARTRLEQAEETRDLTARQVAEGVSQAEAALETARANSEAAQGNRDKAARDRARLQALYRDGAISAQQVDAARAAHDAARAQYEASLQVVRQAEVARQLARANLKQVEIRERDVAAARAQVRQAEATLRSARAGEEMLTQRRADVAAAAAQGAQARGGARVFLTQPPNLMR